MICSIQTIEHFPANFSRRLWVELRIARLHSFGWASGNPRVVLAAIAIFKAGAARHPHKHLLDFIRISSFWAMSIFLQTCKLWHSNPPFIMCFPNWRRSIQMNTQSF